MYRAKPVTQAEAPEFYAAVEELCRSYRIPMPRLYVIPQEAPNAFATGRSPAHAAVMNTFEYLDTRIKSLHSGGGPERKDYPISCQSAKTYRLKRTYSMGRFFCFQMFKSV